MKNRTSFIALTALVVLAGCHSTALNTRSGREASVLTAMEGTTTDNDTDLMRAYGDMEAKVARAHGDREVKYAEADSTRLSARSRYRTEAAMTDAAHDCNELMILGNLTEEQRARCIWVDQTTLMLQVWGGPGFGFMPYMYGYLGEGGEIIGAGYAYGQLQQGGSSSMVDASLQQRVHELETRQQNAENRIRTVAKEFKDDQQARKAK